MKNQAESKGIESTSTETTSHVAVETAGETGEEHCDRSTANEEPDRTVCEGHHARCLHLVVEAGSIVLQVSNNMSEGKKDGEDEEDGEEAGETAATKETEEISKRRGNPKTHRGDEKYTQRKETTTERSEQMHKKCIRDKNLKRQQDIRRILEHFKGVRNIPGIKSAKKKVLITMIKNEQGEIITSREGISYVFGEFYKELYDDNEQDESEQEIGENGNESSTVVQNNDTDEMTRIPEITTTAINKLKKRQNTRQQWDPSRRHQSMRR